MNLQNATLASTTLALVLSYALLQTQAGLAQAPAAGAPKGGPAKAPDPRVQQRKYHFAESSATATPCCVATHWISRRTAVTFWSALWVTTRKAGTARR